MSIDVRLRAIWIAGAGYRYDVILDGEVIVHRSRDPEHDAARVSMPAACAVASAPSMPSPAATA